LIDVNEFELPSDVTVEVSVEGDVFIEFIEYEPKMFEMRHIDDFSGEVDVIGIEEFTKEVLGDDWLDDGKA